MKYRLCLHLNAANHGLQNLSLNLPAKIRKQRHFAFEEFVESV